MIGIFFTLFFAVYYKYSSNHNFVRIEICRFCGLFRIIKTISRSQCWESRNKIKGFKYIFKSYFY